MKPSEIEDTVIQYMHVLKKPEENEMQIKLLKYWFEENGIEVKIESHGIAWKLKTKGYIGNA